MIRLFTGIHDMTSRTLVDPELVAGLDMPMPRAVDHASLAEYRAWIGEMVAALPKPPPEVSERVQLEERLVPGPVGAPPVRMLVYTPKDRGEELLPALLHIHGGGFVSCSAEIADARNRALVAESRCVVVSVDYRLAPETPYPGPVEDCYAGLKWLHSSAAVLGVDPERIVVGGESAGGGLAAALCLLARDRGKVRPCFQYLSEPMLDDRSAGSDHPHVGQFIWTREQNRFGWSSMLKDLGDGAIPPYASPARAEDLAGLPPAFIQVGAIDLFLEESLEYARRLTRAGVSVELHVWPGAYHAFSGFDTHVAREARRVAHAALRRAMHGTVTQPPRDGTALRSRE
jgi:acetyl esterase/lipase